MTAPESDDHVSAMQRKIAEGLGIPLPALLAGVRQFGIPESGIGQENSMQRVLRWDVPVDDQWHDIGAGAVVHVAARGYRERPGDLVEVWTLESSPGAGLDPGDVRKRSVSVFGTGHLLPRDAQHIGSAVVPSFRVVSGPTRGTVVHIESTAGLMWHVFAKYAPPAETPHIAGFRRGHLVTIGPNGDKYEGQTGVVATLDHDHGWRLWVRVGVDVHDQHAPALYLSPDDIDMVVVP